jgi:tryptophan-rich sensory protein
MNPWFLAGLVCASFALVEALMAGRGVKRFMQELKQPDWSLPLPAWYAIGLLYYAACYAVLVPMLRSRPTATKEFWLLMGIMSVNCVWNFFFFRRRDFRKSFWGCILYSVFVVVLLWRLFPTHSPSVWIFLAYALYFPYSWFWTYRVWRLNSGDASLPARA